jgi:hypothetical protein
MKNYILVFVAMITLALQSFNVFSQGAREFKVDKFHSIDLNDPLTVYLAQGEQKIIVEGDPEDVRNIDFSVSNGVLSVKSNGVSNSKDLIITIYTTTLSKIEINGVSKLISKTAIKADTLTINMNGASKAELEFEVSKLIADVNGAAKLNLKGNANQMSAITNGAAKLSAGEFNVNKVRIELNGVSKANVNAIQDLYGTVNGISKLSYVKEPAGRNVITRNTFKLDGYDDENESDTNGQTMVRTSENGDTVVVNIPGVKIKVNEKTDEAKINIGDKEYTFNENGVNVTKTKKADKFRPHWAGFEMGFNGYFSEDMSLSIPKEYSFLELNYVKSLNVNINFVEIGANIFKNRFGVVSGLGLQWNNWRFDNDVVLSPDSAQIYGYHDKSIDSYIKSKLTASWLRLPVFFEYQTSKLNHKNQFYVSAGAVLGLRLGAHSKQVHFQDGDRSKPKIYDDFHLNPFKVDAEIRIGWGMINLFANYSITTMFKDGEGPVLHPYTIGLTLVNF